MGITARMRTLAGLLAALLFLGGPARGATTLAPVSVAYAGSLVTPMEGPIATALAARDRMRFIGEPRGSKAIANLILQGLRSPDVFISADRRDVARLAARGLVARAITFASASLVLGFAPTRHGRALYAAAKSGTRAAVLRVLRTPGLRIARTDPALDPKGARTIEALHMLGLSPSLGVVFPEEDLLVRLETGEADIGFLYSTEAVARKLAYVRLPGKASLSDKITYTLAILKHAPHPQAAERFAAFVLSGAGRRILEASGITYTTHHR